ncbi:MAG: putative aminohydrolase SsnA [Tissierellia bacterium]|nr:putative aminohydrolase SsnA [Tissierellia bacterium]
MIIGNGKLITNNEEQPLIENGAVVIDKNEIIDFGPTKDMRKKFAEKEFHDVEGRVIMPGMINCHTHIYSAFGRGMSVSKPTRDFIEILENQWWALDKKLTLEASEKSAYGTLIESVRNGVTTVFDHHASPYHIEESLFRIAKACEDVGMRADLCYEVSDRDGLEITKAGIKENIDFIKAYNTSKQDLIHGHFGLHASFTISNETMELIKEAMEGVDAGYHIHCAEGIEDEYDSLEKYGQRVIERFQGWDMLGEKTLAIHCCNVNNYEVKILRDTNTNVVHNPESNMGNAVGVTPVLYMLNQGVRLGLGTDAYTNDMFESMKVAKILQSHTHADPTVGFNESLQLQMVNNRDIASRFFDKKLGIIEKGAYADIITLDYNNYTPITKDNIGGHILFGFSGRMTVDTIINGKFVMKEREIQTVDEERIFAETQQLVPKIWKGL